MRHRRVRRGSGRRGGGRDLSDAEIELLRPALEAAVDIARVAERSGAGSAPPALKPFLRFTSMPTKALASVKKVLDADDDLRERVAGLLSDDEIGPAAREWLSRGDGWRDRYDELIDEHRHAEREAEIERSERRARKKLSAAEAARDRAEEEASRLRSDLDVAAEDLSTERTRRREAEESTAAARDEIAAVEEKLARAIGDLDDARGLAQRRLAERRELEDRVAALDEELAERRGLEDRVAALDEELAERRGLEDGTAPDRGAVHDALVQATAGVRTLAEAIDRLAGLVAPGPDPDAAPTETPPPRPERRRPLRVPPGLVADSDAALAHFLAVPDVLVLVDGYNVAMAGWPDMAIADQRERLVAGLENLSARTGAAFDVVFDGADVAPVSTGGRTLGVRVRFSPDGVEADDVIIADASAVPVARPLVVVSNDRRVRSGAADAGATVVSSDRLLAAMGHRVP